jgi:acyl-CoA thioester hydrolase
MHNSIPPAKIQVRFADCDMMGHVNNAVYLSYFEQTRMHYFAYLVGNKWDWKKHGIILVHNELTYHSPVFLEDLPEITMFLGEIGKTSFLLHYEVKVNGKLCTSGASKLVCFNFESNKSVDVYPDMLKGFSKLNKK